MIADGVQSVQEGEICWAHVGFVVDAYAANSLSWAFGSGEGQLDHIEVTISPLG